MSHPSLRQLTVLLASAEPERSEAIARRLLADGAEIRRSALDGALEAAVAAQAPDALLLHAAGPEPAVLASLRAIALRIPCALLLDRDAPDFIAAALAAGAGAYTPTETALLDPKPVLRSAIAAFAREQRLTAELRRTQRLLAEQRAIARAKTLLMRWHKMSEAAAYRWLQRRAMNSGRRLVEIAEEIVGRRNR